MYTLNRFLLIVTLLTYFSGLSYAQDTICIYFDTINVEQVSVEPSVYRIPMYASNLVEVSGLITDIRIAGDGNLKILDLNIDESIESAGDFNVFSEDSTRVANNFNSQAPAFSWPNDTPLGYLEVQADLLNGSISIEFVSQTAITVISNPPVLPVKGIDVESVMYDPQRELTGVVQEIGGAPVPNIILSLQTPDSLLYDTTDTEGLYEFSVPAAPGSFQLTVVGPNELYSRTERISGINVVDIDLIYRHAAGTLLLSNASALITADVNEDSNIDALDAELIREYTFLKIDAFPGSPHFRFLTQEEEPKETVSFENGIPADQEIDFVFLKKGNVNFSN
ncbi:hypothetical protein FUA23_16695 [Neolewinella aurantiaca]|uniref:Dockerin domain-containing protein n=1 Tax=Neolewinella aurantiaca TaxID=2602767 RepID=A0A5C7FTA4_9BACT|nr:dockerin type I repeat-containing protein [Neolewinella aurantiaca]TXF87998.1 hypothetical protein FUA23_16695 [Neolewinella aurantiaca]